MFFFLDLRRVFGHGGRPLFKPPHIWMGHPVHCIDSKKSRDEEKNTVINWGEFYGILFMQRNEKSSSFFLLLRVKNDEIYPRTFRFLRDSWDKQIDGD